MKFNWGTGITIGLISFMAFITTLGVKMMTQKVDLVTKDYYEQGIDYEKQMERIKAADALSSPVTINVNYETAQLNITLPAEFANKKVQGTILLFRPADASRDVSLNLMLDNTQHQNIPLEKMARGNWRVKVQWKCDGVDYYHEEEVVI